MYVVIVICNGMMRSGSTWSFNLVRLLLQQFYPSDSIYSGYDEEGGRFLSAAPACTKHVVWKCHGLDPIGRLLAETQAAKVIYTWRDLADAIYSAMRVFEMDFASALASMDASLDQLDFHQANGNAFIVSYAEMITDSARCIQRIGEWLAPGGVSAEIAAQLSDQNSVDRTRARIDEVNRTTPDALISVGRFRCHPETLLHWNHIQNGASGYGRRALSSQELNQADDLMARHRLTPPEPFLAKPPAVSS